MTNCHELFLHGFSKLARIIIILRKSFTYNFKTYVENRLVNTEIIFAWKSMVAKVFSLKLNDALKITRIFHYKVWRCNIYYLLKGTIVSSLPRILGFFRDFGCNVVRFSRNETATNPNLVMLWQGNFTDI